MYPREAVTALQVIKAQRLKFTLAEVAELLEAGRHLHRTDMGKQEQARAKLANVEAKIADLEVIAGTLRAAQVARRGSSRLRDGVAVTSGVLQSRFAADLQNAPSEYGLTPTAIEQITSSLLAGGGTVEPIGLGPEVRRFVQTALADAINDALLSCVAMAVLGGVVGAFFVSSRRRRMSRAERSPSFDGAERTRRPRSG